MKPLNLPACLLLSLLSLGMLWSCTERNPGVTSSNLGFQSDDAAQEQSQSSTNVLASFENQTIAPGSEQVGEYILDIFEDSKGNLWFGTIQYGAGCVVEGKLTYLTQEDGLIDNTIVSIAEDQQGNLWFGTHAGVSKYDGKSFTNFGRAEGLTGMGCKVLIDRHDRLWVGSNHGAFRFDGTTFSPFPLPNPGIENPSYKWETGKVWSLMEDSKGNIWFARDGFGACKYDGNSFSHFTRKDGLCSNNVSVVLEDRPGNIWFGSLSSDQPTFINEGGLSRFDGKEFMQFSEKEGLSKNDIYTVVRDNSGNVWVAAIGHGAYRFQGENSEFFNHVDGPEMSSMFGIQSFLEDSKGILWFGFSGGLYRFEGSSFVNVTRKGPWK